MQFALVVFRSVVQGSFPSTLVIQCQACLWGNASHSHRPFLSSIGARFLAKTRWYVLYPLSLIFDALAWFTASQSSSKSGNQVFLYSFLRFLPTDPARESHVADQCPNTRCSWKATCVLRVFEKDRSSPTSSLIMKSIPMSRSEVDALKKYEYGRGASSPWSAGVGTEVYDLKSSFQERMRTRQTTRGFRKDEWQIKHDSYRFRHTRITRQDT